MIELIDAKDEVLKQPLDLVDFSSLTEDLLSVGTDMLAFMRRASGLGLAAPQVNIKHRMFVMEGINGPLICINPSVEECISTESIDKEGCLSFPGLYLKINRCNNIQVSYYNPDGEEIKARLDGLYARIFLHELDHVNGVTFDTHVSKFNLRRANEQRRKQDKKLSRKKAIS